MATDLLACPFCGSKSVQSFKRPDGIFSWVYCGPCGAQGPVEAGHPDASTPEERWNRRATLAEERSSTRDHAPTLRAALEGAERQIATLYTTIARGDAEAGERFAANDPAVIEARAALASSTPESAVYPPQDIATVRDWLRELPSLDMEDIAADGGVTVAMVVQQQAREMAARLERALREISAKAAGEQE